jgi:deazaflavin-dependent oxidoreductase (nitroreductase family)
MAAARLNWQLRLAWRLHRWIYGLSGGRIGTMVNGMPVLMLTTRGRRSGELRTVALQYLRAGDAYVVIGSYVGENKHPAWWMNLVAEPDATVRRGGRVEGIRAREADGQERELLWREIVAIDPAYAEYQQRTSRRIPVILLEPVIP